MPDSESSATAGSLLALPGWAIVVRPLAHERGVRLVKGMLGL